MDERINPRQDESDTSSPAEIFSIFRSCHHLYEKLFLLQYSSDFTREYNCKPIHRYYFSVQSNPGEQFYTFSCLSAWLIKSRSGLKIGSRELNPQEYEDPNVTISTILDVIREGTGEKMDFPPSKLKQGWGREVIWILNVLADLSLKHWYQKSAKITLKGLESVDMEHDGLFSGENDPEISFDEQFNVMDEDDDEDEDDDGVGERKVHTKQHEITESIQSVGTGDREAWIQEVERVLPQLRVVVRSVDSKSDWRLRVGQLDQTNKEMERQFESTKSWLHRLTREISQNLSRISQREEYLQSQFEPLISEYIGLKSQLTQLNDKYANVSKGITEKSRILSEIGDELESMKTEMEERGSSMTDGSPLVSLRKAVQRLRSEVASIDIRIGVSTHTILQANVKDSMQQQQSMTRKPIDGQDVSPFLMSKRADSLQNLLF